MSKFLIKDGGFVLETGHFRLSSEDEPTCCCPSLVGACTACAETGVLANYFNSTTIGVDLPLGDPEPPIVLTRIEDNIDLNATGSPGPGVNTDDFCVRWRFYVTPETTDTYTFYFTSQHGVRVYVAGSGTPSLNQWTSHSSATHSFTRSMTKGTPVIFTVEFRNDTGDAICKMEWSYTGQAQTLIPKRNLTPSISSLGVTGNPISYGTTATAFNNLTLSGTGTLTAGADSPINFSYAGAPTAEFGFPTDNWSARYEGFVLGPTIIASVPPSTTDVTFYLTHKDGARLWINGALVIDAWVDGGPTTDTSAPVTMKIGHYYPIKVEMYSKTGTSNIKLEWSYTGLSQNLVTGHAGGGALIRGSAIEVPAEASVTFSGVTIHSGCTDISSSSQNSSGSLGTHCADRAAACGLESRESPGTSIVSTLYSSTGCGGTPTPSDLVITINRSYGKVTVLAAAGLHTFFSGSAASFDCNETVTVQNDITSATSSNRGTGGFAVITPGMCS